MARAEGRVATPRVGPTIVRRLVLVTLLVGVLTSVIGLAVVRHLERGTLLEAASDAELAAAERTANVVDSRIEALTVKLELLATRDEVLGLADELPDELDAALAAIEAFDELVVFDADGALIAAARSGAPSEVASETTSQDVSGLTDRPRARTSGEGLERHLEVSVPFGPDTAAATGVLLGRADLDVVAEGVTRQLATGGRASLVDGDGVTLVDGDETRTADGYVQPIAELPTGRTVASLDGPEGRAIVAAAPLRTLEGAVVVEQTEADVMDDVASGLRGPAGVLLVVVVAVVVAVIAVGQRLLRPLGPVTDGVRRLGAGEDGVRITEEGTGEVGDLARGFNTMAAALEHRRRELEEAERTARSSEERLRLVVEGVQDYAIVLLDLLGHVRTWNAGAERVTGAREPEILGRPLSSLADPGQPYVDPLAEATRTGRGEVEGWYRRPDGSRYRGQLTVTALRREDGSLYGYAAILQDVTERLAVRDALEDTLRREQEAATELRHANQLKDEFLAVAAHEMRTPLSAILGASQLLAAADQLSADEADEVVDLVRTHAADMHDIVERLLEFSQLQAGRVRLEVRPTGVRAAVDGAVAGVRRVLLAHMVAVDAPPPDVEIEIDPQALHHVLTNLLSNAAKFSPPGTTIRVSAVVVDGRLQVGVADEGIGIAPEDHERVFELFRQAEHEAPSARGTGVGLAIVRGYAELAGGHVDLVSEIGAGARFTVHLPLRTAAVAGAE